jgi:hypothetical protein
MHGGCITAAQAETIAMAAVRQKGATAVEAYLVERLDAGNPYFLVLFGKPGSAGAIVAVDALDGTIASSAQLERVESPWFLSKARAVELAGGSRLLQARLVWAPSRATRSPFYPLWEITCESGRVYVDRDGKVSQTLMPAGPG